MNLSSLFSVRLKNERIRLGFTQAEIASKCGVSREMWGKYERGVAFAGSEVLFSLVAIGVDVGYLFSGEKNTIGMTKEEASLIDDYRHMNEQGKAAVTTSARAMAQQELFKKNKVS